MSDLAGGTTVALPSRTQGRSTFHQCISGAYLSGRATLINEWGEKRRYRQVEVKRTLGRVGRSPRNVIFVSVGTPTQIAFIKGGATSPSQRSLTSDNSLCQRRLPQTAVCCRPKHSAFPKLDLRDRASSWSLGRKAHLLQTTWPTSGRLSQSKGTTAGIIFARGGRRPEIFLATRQIFSLA